ncbi:MAG TPA: penicillin-binding transpeptidase domain-containing protein [Patescibacteria group bacterium]|nr:penicillin-binding transpeptidase domain-containing protein [Patescibacteria group bacterium]
MRKKTFPILIFDSISKHGQKERSRLNIEAAGDLGDSGDPLQKIPPGRIFAFYILAVLAAVFFLLGLFNLTVVNGEENRRLADENRIRLVDIEQERGRILDRNGKVLADSQRTYYLKKGFKFTKINKQQVDDLQNQGLASENFEGDLGLIVQEVQRNYPQATASAHLIGYVSGPQEADAKNGQQISPVEKVGRLGIEEYYDDFLRGKLGKKLIEVDSQEKKVTILGTEEPKIGATLNLTLDYALQKAAFDALKKGIETAKAKKGAVIAQDPQSGGILALVSFPSFDPDNIQKSKDEDQPFFNRAISGVYPPGSVFKIATSLAGLETGQITKDTEIEDVGEFEIAGTKFANWYFLTYGKKDGVLKIDKAIARSNDIFFFRVAERTGLDAIRQMAKKLGFGQKTGVDLPGEAFGLLPDEVWKKSTLGDQWFLGDTLHLAIGQGFMLTTPAQVNLMTSYMASGKIYKPHVVSKIENLGEGAKPIEISSKVMVENLVSSENFDLVRQGMKKACEQGGTAFPFFTAPYKVGCKTGTAEKSLGNPHAWFTAFAPFDNPAISITVIIEDGGEGSAIAAPVAREILDWMFQNKN